MPTYNVQSALTARNTSIVLDIQTIADIYLNKIQYWWHPNISRLNPSLSSIISNRSIIVTYENYPSWVTEVFTEALSAAVPEFKLKVGSGSMVNFSVDASRTRRANSTSQMLDILRST